MFEKQTMELTEQAQDWLDSFDALPAEQRLLVAQEIQKRLGGAAGSSDEEDADMSPVAAEEMTFLARRLFQMYDEEERQNGCP